MAIMGRLNPKQIADELKLFELPQLSQQQQEGVAVPQHIFLHKMQWANIREYLRLSQSVGYPFSCLR